MIDKLKKFFQEETFYERSKRMIPAVGYGALIAFIYTLTLSFINVYTFPDLPLGMDWTRVLGMSLGFSTAFAVFGAIAAWFTDDFDGIVGGGLIATLLLIPIFLVSSSTQKNSLTVQSVTMALPLVGVNILGAWGLRWTARRHLEISRVDTPELRRKNMMRHVLIIFVVGLVPGILGRMGLPTKQTLEQFHKYLQAAPTDSSVLPHLPLKQVPALQDHFGVDYKFYPRQSVLSVGVLDLVVHFQDGFRMTCRIPVTSRTSFITDCIEGDSIN